MAEVTVTESYAVVPASGGAAGHRGTRRDDAAAAPPKGAVLRIRPTGEIDTLWSSPDDVPHSLVRSGADVLVGTGNKGKVYRVGDDGRWALVATLPAEQVTALARGAAGGVVARDRRTRPGSSPSTPTLAAEGTFLSKVKDTETVSSWGQVSWEGTAPPGTEVRVQTQGGQHGRPRTRRGPTGRRRRPARRASPIRSEKARFLQLRLTLAGKAGASPTVEAVAAAYQQRNLPPVVKSITVHPAGEAFQKPISVSGEPEILGLDTDPLSDRAAAQRPRAGSPPAITFSRKLYQRGLRTFSWQAEDPNADPLLFDVEYRAVGDDRWRPLRTGLDEPVFAWDTATVPNGRYLLRVVASDAPGNPPALALTGSKASVVVRGGQPPALDHRDARPARRNRIRVTVRDDASPVRKLETSIDAGRWEEVHPIDGIADSLEESYEIPLPPGTGRPRIVVLRATDLLGNVATARVDVP